jgi:3-dehydroquinate synthase
MSTIEVQLGSRSYPVHVGSGMLENSALIADSIRGRHVLIVSNETVAPLYLDRLQAALHGHDASTFLLADGESHKSFENVGKAMTVLAQLGASRDATIVALGGGVVGDLAGFAAALWMRGIAFVQIPTTLLAMVDSSVGGKTGVNLPQGKNLVGAFHQPRAVFIDPETVRTLPERELLAGLAEVIKYAAIGDIEFMGWLEANAQALLDRDSAALQRAIETSVRHKARVVAADEHERGERALLNLGHTFGHAIEAATHYKRFLHGEAVAIGMLAAARLSAALGMASVADADRLQALLARCGLPTTIPEDLDDARLLDLMRLDKKAESGRLRLILWRGIGCAEIVSGVADTDILAALQAMH